MTPPKITIDDGAAKQIKAADDGPATSSASRSATPGGMTSPSTRRSRATSSREANGVKVHMDRGSAKKADGLSISWVETKDGGAFRIEQNPNEPRA